MSALVLFFEPTDTDLETLVKPKRVLERDRKQLLCAACANPVTRPEMRIEASGTHQHTFTNPAGFTYVIGCFADAPGCAQSGIYTAEWSWFADHEWRYAHCRQCSAHLGWHFRGVDRFFGLILERLVEPH